LKYGAIIAYIETQTIRTSIRGKKPFIATKMNKINSRRTAMRLRYAILPTLLFVTSVQAAPIYYDVVIDGFTMSNTSSIVAKFKVEDLNCDNILTNDEVISLSLTNYTPSGGSYTRWDYELSSTFEMNLDETMILGDDDNEKLFIYHSNPFYTQSLSFCPGTNHSCFEMVEYFDQQSPGAYAAQTSTTIPIIARPSAIPVPAAAWLFGSGLVGLAGVAYRRKDQALSQRQ
jgi:hypothetical protein